MAAKNNLRLLSNQKEYQSYYILCCFVYMPHIQSSLQIQIENRVVPTDDVGETTEVTRDPGDFPQ